MIGGINEYILKDKVQSLVEEIGRDELLEISIEEIKRSILNRLLLDEKFLDRLVSGDTTRPTLIYRRALEALTDAGWDYKPEDIFYRYGELLLNRKWAKFEMSLFLTKLI